MSSATFNKGLYDITCNSMCMVDNYALAASSVGIWYSSNYGESWLLSQSTSGFSFTSIYMVASTNASGNPAYYAIAISSSTNIWNSSSTDTTDVGVLWSASTSDTITDVPFISIYMLDTGEALAGSNNDTGLYSSSDFGVSWSQTSQTYGSFLSICMVASTDSSSYTATAGARATIGNSWVFTYDGGASWQQTTSCCYFTYNSVFIVAANDTYYTIVSGPNELTTDYGVISYLEGQYYDVAVASLEESLPCKQLYMLDTGQALAAFEGGIGIYYSSNYGATWALSQSTSGFSFTSIYMVASTDTNGNPVYYATAGGADDNGGGGAWYSSDAGATWTQTLSTGTINTVFMAGTYAVAGGKSTSGLWYSSNYGLSWSQTNVTISIFVSSIYSNGVNSIALAETVHSSKNSGQSWSSSNLTNSGIVSGYIAKNGTAGVGTNAGKIYNSINGTTWSESTVTTSTTSKYMASKSRSRAALPSFNSFATTSEGRYALVASSDGMYRTENSGKSWFLSLQTSGYEFSSVAMNDDNGVALAASPSGLWSSRSYGVSWEQIANTTGIEFTLVAMSGKFGVAASNSNGLWYLHLTDNDLSIIPSNIKSGTYNSIAISGRQAVAAGPGGVLYSFNNGATWLKSNLSLDTVAVSISGNNVVACVSGYGAYGSSNAGKTFKLTNLTNGTVNSVSVVGSNVIVGSESGIYYSINIPCFKEDTKILTDKGYIPIQDLRKGDLVKTLNHDYKPIDMIGKRTIHHPASQERIKDQLYECSQTEYPEVFEPLFITGRHSILVDNFTGEEQKKKVIEVNGDTYLTDKKYRLPACADLRSSVYEKPGTYTIYHLALESDNYNMNYGIYANGLEVETCSKRYLMEFSNMDLF